MVNEDLHQDPAPEKKRWPAWLKWTIAAVSLCLIGICVFMLLKPQSEQDDILIVNKPDNRRHVDYAIAESRYDDLSEAERKAAADAFEANTDLSYDVFTANLTDSFVLTYFGSVDRFYGDAKGYIPHDFVFNVQAENGHWAQIAICAEEEPLRELVLSCKRPKTSYISGVPLYIYSYSTGYYENCLTVDFTYENIHYAINTYDLTLEELEILLRDIIQ